MRAAVVSYVLPVTALLLLVACAPGNVAPAAVPEPAAKAPVSTSQEPWQIKWDNVLNGAKKEGTVVVSMSAGGGKLRDTMVSEFGRKYGIKVEAISSQGAQFTNRLFAERRGGIYNWDVYQGGGTTTTLVLKPREVFDPLVPALILPEVTDPKAWFRGEMPWRDKDHLSLGFLAFVSIPLAINTVSVSPGDIQSFNDLLDPKWKGRMTMQDPTQAGYGSTMVGLLGEYIMSYDWLRQLAKQEPVIVRDKRLLVDWLAQGKYHISIGPDSTRTTELQAAGAPIANLIPREGTNLSAGSGTVSMFNRAPHPNAATAYINWLLSREGQLTYSKAALLQSSRVDIPTDFLPKERVRQPGINYIYTDKEEFVLKHEEYYKIGNEIFGHLVK